VLLHISKVKIVPHLKSHACAVLISLGLVAGGCGGSAEPEPPALSVSSEGISEAEAIAAAEAVADEKGLETQDLVVEPGLLFGEWQVSYEPANTDSLSGGFLVVLDAATGELIEVVEYQ